MTRISGITQNLVGETLLLNGPPFVYRLWKIHFLTCDNISLSLLLLLLLCFLLFTSFLHRYTAEVAVFHPSRCFILAF
jgi:hypothetical protein